MTLTATVGKKHPALVAWGEYQIALARDRVISHHARAALGKAMEQTRQNVLDVTFDDYNLNDEEQGSGSASSSGA